MKSRKTTLKKWASFALAFLLAGCVDPTSGSLNGVYPENLWGEWIRVDTGKSWYITSSHMDGDLSKRSIKSMTRQSDKVIKIIGEEDRPYYLYASRIPNGRFSGTIVGDESGRSSFPRFSTSKTGGMEAIIRKLSDKANEIYARTDENGNFTAEGIIPGDKYEVTVEGQSTVVTPNTDGENIGTVTVTEGANFKISVIPDSNTDMMRLYAGTEDENFYVYVLVIVITNTGTEDFVAANYKVTYPSGVVGIALPSGEQGIIPTIEPGEHGYLGYGFFCPSITEEFEYKTIQLELRTLDKIWNDSVQLKFNKEKVTFNINSKSQSVSGVVIVPSAKAYPFQTSGSSGSYSASIEVPKYSGKDYLVVFSGATANTETVYSLGAGVPADTIGVYDDAYAHEPNDTEEEAHVLIPPKNKITSYLRKNDIDYYRVRF